MAIPRYLQPSLNHPVNESGIGKLAKYWGNVTFTNPAKGCIISTVKVLIAKKMENLKNFVDLKQSIIEHNK